MSGKKAVQREQLLEHLQEQMQPVQPDDPMAEAGRKVLLSEFIRMLQHEAGSRSGEDIEDVHKMRVAIRQTRSAIRLLETYYKPDVLRPFDGDLKRIMRALGAVRDLDVMIHDLRQFDTPAEPAQAAALQEVIDALNHRRDVARAALVKTLNSKTYRRFVKAYTKFLSRPGKGALRPAADVVAPYQVRHVLPPLIYEHLAAVRAYDPVLEEADSETLHALRIEFKRLRYVVSLFSGILGKDIDAFISELKQMQDVLGRMNDIEVARQSLTDLMEDLDGGQSAALWLYIEHLEQEKPALHARFPEVWRRFNRKGVQRKLASAVAVL